MIERPALPLSERLAPRALERPALPQQRALSLSEQPAPHHEQPAPEAHVAGTAAAQLTIA